MERYIKDMIKMLEEASRGTDAEALATIRELKAILDTTRPNWETKPGPEHLEYLKYLYFAKCRLENNQWRLAAAEISDVLQDMALHSRMPDGHLFLDRTILENLYYLLERMVS